MPVGDQRRCGKHKFSLRIPDNRLKKRVQLPLSLQPFIIIVINSLRSQTCPQIIEEVASDTKVVGEKKEQKQEEKRDNKKVIVSDAKCP